MKNYPKVDEVEDLNEILFEFYSSVQPQKKTNILYKHWNVFNQDLTDTSEKPLE